MFEKWIYVNTQSQQLSLRRNEVVLAEYPVSTAKEGLGEKMNSEKTPRGWLCIEKKIGDRAPINTVFVSREPTGEIYSDKLAAEFPNRDWILTRIMWLAGLEEGKNKGGDVDTFPRYIYIHGCPDSVSLEKPLSHGCIRMHNTDLIALFDAVHEKMPIFIGDELPVNVKEIVL